MYLEYANDKGTMKDRAEDQIILTLRRSYVNNKEF